MQHFGFPDLGKEKLCSILVFGNLCFNIVVRISDDNVASRGAVGRTHTIVRLQTRTRRKDWTENFGGFVYVLDGFLQRDFVLWVFMCLISFSLFLLSLFSGYLAEGYQATDTARAITPRAITPLPPLHGYHARVYISRLSRHSLFLLLGYHARAITLHHTRKSGYHTTPCMIGDGPICPICCW